MKQTFADSSQMIEDDELDMAEIKALLRQIEKGIDAASNRVKYTMNGFVIAVGSYVLPLRKQAKTTAKKLGMVNVESSRTSCKVPLATVYIEKIQKSSRAEKNARRSSVSTTFVRTPNPVQRAVRVNQVVELRVASG